MGFHRVAFFGRGWEREWMTIVNDDDFSIGNDNEDFLLSLDDGFPLFLVAWAEGE